MPEVPAAKCDQKTLTVESNKLFTPPVRVGDSVVVKVKLRNLGSDAHEVNVFGLCPPFTTDHFNFKVKAKSFLNLPILYNPTHSGPHECMVEFKSSQINVTPILVKIKGTTL